MIGVLKEELQEALCGIGVVYKLDLSGVEINITNHNKLGITYDIKVIKSPIDKMLIADFIEAYLIKNDQIKQLESKYTLIKRYDYISVRLIIF